MNWTVGTFWTMGKDALDTGDRLWTAWTPGTGCGLLGRRGLTGVHYYYLAALGRSGIFCREAAEALKARNIPAQGKHAESVRRPG